MKKFILLFAIVSVSISSFAYNHRYFIDQNEIPLNSNANVLAVSYYQQLFFSQYITTSKLHIDIELNMGGDSWYWDQQPEPNKGAAYVRVNYDGCDYHTTAYHDKYGSTNESITNSCNCPKLLTAYGVRSESGTDIGYVCFEW